MIGPHYQADIPPFQGHYMAELSGKRSAGAVMCAVSVFLMYNVVIILQHMNMKITWFGVQKYFQKAKWKNIFWIPELTARGS